MKQIIALTLFLNLSCMNSQNVTWYEKEVIQEIKKQDNDNYIIQIGISAQIFYLDRKIENFDKIFSIISDSYNNKIEIKIGIENNTNRILCAQKLKN